MALVATTNPLALAAHETAMTRTEEALSDVQREIASYILEQRAHGPLRLAADDHDARTALRATPGQAGRSSAPPPRRPVLRCSGWGSPSLSPPPSPAQELLDAIFDTPECRTEPTSPSPECRLHRSGATFIRVEPAVVEETERRFDRWARRDFVRALEEDERSWTDASSRASSCDGRAEEEHATGVTPSGPGSLFPALCVIAGATRPSLRRNPSSESFVRGDDRAHVSTSTAEDTDSLETEAAGAEAVGAEDAPPTGPSTDPVDAPEAPDASDFLADSDEPDDQPLGEDDDETAEAPVEPSTDRPTAIAAARPHHAKAWRWLSPKKIPPVLRVKSVSRRARRRVAHNNRAAAAKARALGGSLTETVNSRVFHRYEVQEMIDTSELQARLAEQAAPEESPGGRESPSHERPGSAAEDGCGGATNEPKEHGPFAALRRAFEVARPSANRRATFSGEPRAHANGRGRSQSHDHLPTIPEVSPLQLEEPALLVPDSASDITAASACSLSRTVSSLSWSTQPSVSMESEGRSWSSLSAVSRSSAGGTDVTYQEKSTGHAGPSGDLDDFDLTTFQMAISGSIGDHLMEGNHLMGREGSADDGCEDEIVDWFFSLGFESEGALERDGDDGDLDDQGEPADDVDPVATECSSSSGGGGEPLRVGVSRTSETRSVPVQPEPASSAAVTKAIGSESEEVGLQMSCNLSNLGDFLTFEVYHMGALASGCDDDGA